MRRSGKSKPKFEYPKARKARLEAMPPLPPDQYPELLPTHQTVSGNKIAYKNRFHQFWKLRDAHKQGGLQPKAAILKAQEELGCLPSADDMDKANHGGPGLFSTGAQDERHPTTEPDIPPETLDKFPAGQGDLKTAVLWTAEHLHVKDADDKCAPPSALAVALWKDYGVNADTRREFYKDFLARYLPTRAQVDNEDERSRDDDVARSTISRCLAACERVGHAVHPSGTEGHEEEPGLATGDRNGSGCRQGARGRSLEDVPG